MRGAGLFDRMALDALEGRPPELEERWERETLTSTGNRGIVRSTAGGWWTARSTN